MFCGERLALARKRKGFTKKALAETVSLTPRAITAFEAGEYAPGDETLSELASSLGFPVDFFLRDELEEIEEGGVSFRAMKRMTASQKHAALAAGTIALEVDRWVSKRFILPEPIVPDLRNLRPEEAAMILRQEWGLGSFSIRNMVHLAESKGIRVFSLYGQAIEVDAFSFWKADRPFIFASQEKSVARRRFDLAHEIGHLCLHKHGAPNGAAAERDADAFASAFLMPRDTVLASGRAYLSLDDLVKLKAKWAVSVAALNRRLYDLNLISEWTYRGNSIELSQRGFRTREPIDYAAETSKIWEQILASLRTSGEGVGKICSDLCLPSDEVAKLVWGLATVAIDGSAQWAGPRKSRGHLRLVE